MTIQAQRGPRGRAGAVAWVVAALVLLSGTEARPQESEPARQVTVFGIVAVPNKAMMDPKLKAIAPQLRRLLPNHGFKLLDVQSKRLTAGQTVSCDLGGGAAAATTLMLPFDDNGKVQLRCEILQNEVSQVATMVATPPNQLFFCDKARPDGSRILIGIGAR
ncbi:hypothetical protein [Singulisphaera acidiphila]|uniref:Uncharacterized protein n=1 Tax=Singulisphaera acidiphila (strain ATCC BAA-1392 / DSM 18658 / VKM B-2454 / MOB10) TaxID=886293 RepID=L0D7G8_SINAD|nr:hypothetical protein [Singulisphaera acidiphila]AGA24773.1 hypothetical protein Sinac_0330 [Singulisphaera acidiphila DSM 18658]